ncbi:MAG: META domain-containing protein [Acidimicrobiia bacterium]|nr:META domain-containing protein [Acidimicrobiia bacterium]MDH4308021.1 META domain-containing protein [Acidimicrobiia bacterium]MDH5294874.1 META domain-containing protein [Acidimicrobiia bacterium]
MNRDADGSWVLVEGSSGAGEIRPAVDSPVTLTVERGAVSGSSGCGEYAVEADITGGRFRLFPDRGLSSPRCDSGLESTQELYWDALQSVISYQVTADRLELLGDGVMLVFSRQQ